MVRREIDVMGLSIDKQFSRRLIKPDTWILNGFMDDCAAPHPHVLIGEKYAAVIDTTDLPFNVRKYVETVVTDKPLVTISSHSHSDHTKNNYQFPDRVQYMSEVCWQEVQTNRIKAPQQAPGDYQATVVKDGDLIDLGGRQIECIDFCGCHSPSSMAFLDLKYGCLFTGDEFEGGQVLLLAGENSVGVYRDNLLKLKERVAGRANCIGPTHNGSPIDILLLDYMIENCQRIMAGIEGEQDVRSMSFGLNPYGYSIDWVDPIHTRRSEWMGTALVYDTRKIYKHSDR